MFAAISAASFYVQNTKIVSDICNNCLSARSSAHIVPPIAAPAVSKE